MGWGRTFLLGDIGNRMDIDDVEKEVARLKHELAGAYELDVTQERRLAMLVKENAELKLYLTATLRLLLAKGVVSRDEIEAVVREVDGSDGEVDGQYHGPVV
ncbi:MAG: hypothetical protein KDA60_12570 [Planctomycetales bacterium]|nr:hypothetical protein [Planctomycetales bacterium]